MIATALVDAEVVLGPREMDRLDEPMPSAIEF